MMEDVTADLDLLAGDMTPISVDLDRVIDTARVRTRRRYALAATSAGTLAVAIAATVVVTTHGSTAQNQTVAAAASSTTRISRDPVLNGIIDKESTKLTGQLANAQASIIPASFSQAPDTTVAVRLNGAPVPPLEFMYTRQQLTTPYNAAAELRDGQGVGVVEISVQKLPAGSPVSACSPEQQQDEHCSVRTLQDGTQVKTGSDLAGAGSGQWTAYNWMEAVRPDGTHITVVSGGPTSVPDPRRTPPLSVAELTKFATVFTY